MTQTEFEDCPKTLFNNKGSDLYYATGTQPNAKFYGTLNQLSDAPMAPVENKVIANIVITDEQQKNFAANQEFNLTIAREGPARFRVNIVWQCNELSMVIGHLGDNLPSYAAGLL